MFGAWSPELNAIVYRMGCKEQLKDMPSGELANLVIDLSKKNERRTVDSYYLAFAGPEDDLFIASGACDVLRERHGEDYIARLTGLRKPRTFGERFKYWMTGRMPKYAQ